MRRRAQLLILALLAFAACGAQTYDEASFVEAANEHDAGFVLGGPLESVRADHRLFELQFEERGAGAGAAAESDHAHGGGTLVVAADADAAEAEYERCQGSASLICFHHANVAFYFGGALAPEELARVEAAIASLDSD